MSIFQNISIIETILASPVIAAAIAANAAIASAMFLYWKQKQKANAAVIFIYQYAKEAEKSAQQWLEDCDDIMKKIKNDKNYTPVIFESKSTTLSLKQMIKIHRHLKNEEQDYLFAYFMTQSTVDSIVNKANTKSPGSFLENRLSLWEFLKEQGEELLKDAKNLAKILEKRKGIAKS